MPDKSVGALGLRSDTLTLTRKSRGISVVTDKGSMHGAAQWEAIMNKFNQNSKKHCKVTGEIDKVARPKKLFPDGSTYEGTWNAFGMNGTGIYTFPRTGVIYEGGFEDSMFHGEGELRYECGAIIKGVWNKGQLTERHLIFADGLEYIEGDWNYCRYPDRRYTIEYDSGLEPAGTSYLTSDQPPPVIPAGFYDVGDGVYDPKTKMVYKYNDTTALIRSTSLREHNWILENCRTAPEIPLGPCNFLYEEWHEPALEMPELPPPSARTRTFKEEEPEFDEIPVGRYITRSFSRRGQFRNRMSTLRNSDFYIPDYFKIRKSRDDLSARSSVASRSSMNSVTAVKISRPDIRPVSFSQTQTAKDRASVADKLSNLSDEPLFKKSKMSSSPLVQIKPYESYIRSGSNAFKIDQSQGPSRTESRSVSRSASRSESRSASRSASTAVSITEKPKARVQLGEISTIDDIRPSSVKVEASISKPKVKLGDVSTII